jgi:hypothetical protein
MHPPYYILYFSILATTTTALPTLITFFAHPHCTGPTLAYEQGVRVGTSMQITGPRKDLYCSVRVQADDGVVCIETGTEGVDVRVQA